MDCGVGYGGSGKNAKPGRENSANGEGGADSGTTGADVGGDFDGSGAAGRYGGDFGALLVISEEDAAAMAVDRLREMLAS